MGQPLSRKRITGQGCRLGKPWRNCTLRSMTGFCKMQRYRSSHFEKGWTEETCIHIDVLAQEDHTYTATCEERISFNDLGASASTKLVKLRQDYKEAVSKNRQAKSAAVTSGDNISHRHNAFRSDQHGSRSSSAHSLTMHIYQVRFDLKQMCKQMRPATAGGHHPLPSGGTDAKTGTRRFFSGAPLTKDDDLHMSDGVCVSSTPHPHALSTQHFSRACLFWWLKVPARCHRFMCALPQRFACDLHIIFHPALLAHSLPQEAQSFPPRQPPGWCWRVFVWHHGIPREPADCAWNRQRIDSKNRGLFSRAAESKSEVMKSVRRTASKANEGVGFVPSEEPEGPCHIRSAAGSWAVW